MSEDSDVYVIATHIPPEVGGRGQIGWECCGCSLNLPDDDDEQGPDFGRWYNTIFRSRQEMVDHLLIHRANFDKVPERAFYRLRKEIDAE